MEKLQKLPGQTVEESQTSSPASIASNGPAAPSPCISHGQPSNTPDDPSPRLHIKAFLAVFAVGLIYFAQVVSLVGSGVQAQTIGAHFGDTSKNVWFAASIAIFTVVLGPILSQAADYWGRKWIIVLPTLAGAVGSVVVSRADSINMVIAGFCITGIAFGPQPLLNAVPAEVLPRRWRGWAGASSLVSSLFGIIVGLFLGAALNRNSDPTTDGFRRYYYVATACYLFSAVVCAVVYNPPPLPTQTQFTHAEKLRKLDWTGYLLFTAGLVLFSVGLSYSKNPYDWSDARVSATFAVGLALSLALIVYETRWKPDGLFHHGLFARNRNFALTLLAIFFEGLGFFAINGFYSAQVSLLYQPDALRSVLPFALICLVAAPVAFLTGWYCARARRVRWVTVAAFLIILAFFACMGGTGRGSAEAVWGFSVLGGMGFSVMLTTLVTLAQLSTPPELISIATGLFISVRSLGGTVGLAIFNAVFNAEMSGLGQNVADAVLPMGLDADELPAFVAALANNNQSALQAVPSATPDIIDTGVSAMLDTYVAAFRHVWTTAACLVVVAVIASAFLIEQEEEFNMLIDHPINTDLRSDAT